MAYRIAGLGLAAGLAFCATANAADLQAQMQLATPNGPGEDVGSVTISETPGGAVFKTDMHGLPPGPHGFHVHENGSCAAGSANGQPVAAGGAGGHFDPSHTGRHDGPMGHGHLGDLPVLQVGEDGTTNETLTAPNIKDLAALQGRALVIHAGGDNFRDQPQPLGGGGARIACGLIR